MQWSSLHHKPHLHTNLDIHPHHNTLKLDTDHHHHSTLKLDTDHHHHSTLKLDTDHHHPNNNNNSNKLML
jgi:hypothetical protein